MMGVQRLRPLGRRRRWLAGDDRVGKRFLDISLELHLTHCHEKSDASPRLHTAKPNLILVIWRNVSLSI
ncbi:hypothetical protein KCU61_g275, partial [Aureobasidium melanogenum]